jgi:hypothetical protein
MVLHDVPARIQANNSMTTTEHLQLIKAECDWLLDSPIATPVAKAGWRSTIAAIDLLDEVMDFEYTYNYHSKIILDAWPIELLTQ